MRKIEIRTEVQKDIEKFDGRERQWTKAIILYLQDEHNSIETIKQKFKPLHGDLSGYYKAKHRGFGIRLVFKILSETEFIMDIEKLKPNEVITECIQLLAVGKRDKIYDLAKKRTDNK